MRPIQFGSRKGKEVVFKTQRLSLIKKRAKAMEWFNDFEDPASLARSITEQEAKEMKNRLAQSGGDWAATKRGLR